MILRFLEKIDCIVSPKEGVILTESKIEKKRKVFGKLPEKDYSEFIGRLDKIEEIKTYITHPKVHVLSIYIIVSEKR